MLYTKRNELGKTKICINLENNNSIIFDIKDILTDQANNWWSPFGQPRPRRSPSTLFLPEGLYENIKDDCSR